MKYNKLIEAAKTGDLPAVKEALEAGANIHACDDDALRWAANNGHLSVVKYLVEQGADIHAKHDEALYWSTLNEHHEVVRYLKLAAKFQAVEI